MRKIINWWYIHKWFFRKDWYYYQSTGRDISSYFEKYTYLKLGEIEGILYYIKKYKEKKLYFLSDYLRNKLIKIGYYWFMTEIINLGNLHGHHKDNLQFIHNDKECSFTGFIRVHGEKDITEISYNAN